MTLEAQYTIREGHYLVCPHCSSRYIKECDEADSVRECMEERSYYRAKGGAWRQR